MLLQSQQVCHTDEGFKGIESKIESIWTAIAVSKAIRLGKSKSQSQTHKSPIAPTTGECKRQSPRFRKLCINPAVTSIGNSISQQQENETQKIEDSVTEDPVTSWLRSLGMVMYDQAFKSQQITPARVRQLTKRDLDTLGVKMGHRKEMLASKESCIDTSAVHWTKAVPVFVSNSDEMKQKAMESMINAADEPIKETQMDETAATRLSNLPTRKLRLANLFDENGDENRETKDWLNPWQSNSDNFTIDESLLSPERDANPKSIASVHCAQSSPSPPSPNVAHVNEPLNEEVGNCSKGVAKQASSHDEITRNQVKAVEYGAGEHTEEKEVTTKRMQTTTATPPPLDDALSFDLNSVAEHSSSQLNQANGPTVTKLHEKPNNLSVCCFMCYQSVAKRDALIPSPSEKPLFPVLNSTTYFCSAKCLNEHEEKITERHNAFQTKLSTAEIVQ